MKSLNNQDYYLGTYGKKWTVMKEKFNFPILMQNKNIGQIMKKLIFRMKIG